MSWRRGTGTVQVELSNVQSWIEATDPELNGQSGVPGIIRIVRETKAAEDQKEKDREQWINRRVQWITIMGGVIGLLKILELVHILPK